MLIEKVFQTNKQPFYISPMSSTHNEILKDSAYKLTQFNADKIQTLESSIIVKETRGTATPYVNCLVRNKEIKLTQKKQSGSYMLCRSRTTWAIPPTVWSLNTALPLAEKKTRRHLHFR